MNKLIIKRRQEPIFWIENNCPYCGHSSPLIYKPDFLSANIDCECQSKFNPLRINHPCTARWSMAPDKKELQNIHNLLKLAEQQDKLYEQIAKNRKLLGYK